jgi:pimeloyl-ACP methyl ester carboxylesterase
MKLVQKSTIILLLSLSCLSLSAQDKPFIPTTLNFENIDYPFPVHYIHLNIQHEALFMAFMDVKPDKPNGKTVVLLHGKNFFGAYWEQTAKALSEKGFRVIIPDQIGFGKSSKPQHIQYSFQLLARNTKAILDSLNINRASIIGHSMGGMLAVRFALMFPERVEKLVLENPIGLEDWKVKIHSPSVEEWCKMEMAQNYESMKSYQLKLYYDGKWKPEYDRWITPVAGWTLNKQDYPLIAWNSALLYDMIFTQPVIYELENIKTKTLLIIGQRDRTVVGKGFAPDSIKPAMGNYPQLGKAATARIKGAKLVEIADTGHLPHIDVFDEFINPLLSFLRN